ncbi:MAG: phage terminase large subunit family protein [Phycisphaerae bacterium]|nr:phage terminase large subunit family protein [Planctomycetia bacterium]MCL4718739.1 phage terminase large subunit family protein [Phycisphaerae bacterium]
MPIDVRKLKPTELVRLLNSTPLGEVISERQLHRHRSRAGFRIGDGRSVDLLRYVAWLVIERHRPRPEPEGLTGYEAMKERARARAEQLSLSGRDIGELPVIMNGERKQGAERDFRFFCEQYFPLTFHLPWSPDHLKVIAKIEQAVLEGGLFAMAMPRGSGKTSLCETACLWALVYGHREFVALIGSDEDHAENMLDSIKVELETNDLLHDDFPEACFPIRALEGIHQRAAGQLYQGKQTHIGWTAKEIVLPTIPGSRASGAIICVAGITGRIRGMKHKRADGSSVRPSLVLIDDPQTDESARSPSQCAARERILAGAILGLAGPGRKIAGLMALTVVRPEDLADRILDRDKHPQWQGERTKMVYAFPANEALWARYAELWREGMRADRGATEAREFYRANREAMDEGAVIAWPERHHPDELSAIQHAMNLRLDRGDAAFWAEYQNEPLPEVQADEDLLTADQIAAKVNGHARGQIPIGATHLTMFIDVQSKALFWLIAAWESDFTGYVIDYGTEPDQRAEYFTLRDIRRSLADAAPRAGPEGAIYAGLERLCDRMVGREWRRDDGAVVRIDRCLIDANWGQSSDVVYQFCRQSKHAGVIMPSHGRYVGASSIPFPDYKRKRGDRIGLNWRIPLVAARRSVRHALFDTNYWKSFVHARLAVPMGDPGCLSLFGRQADPHRLLAEHLTSEYRVKTEGRGRTVDEWKLRLDGADNHWLDCLVGCAVGASMEGAVLFGTDARVARRVKIKLSELQGARR